MKEQLLLILENSRNYTQAVAAAMPENLYHAKPANDVWNFGELLSHIAYGIQWWESNFIRSTATDWAPPAAGNSKEEINSSLEEAYGIVRKILEGIELSASHVAGFHATLDHITHHRGQAVLYLRCNGITPPEYTY